MQLLKKMSVKSILGNVLAAFAVNETTKQPNLGDKKVLFRVFGIANSSKTGTSNFGEWTSFKGLFEAIILETGEVLRSSDLFLPEVATDALLPVVAKNVEDGGNGVRFAMDIGAVIVADRTNPLVMKYEYTCAPVIDVAQDDPLAAFKAVLPALPAPTKPKQAALPGTDDSATAGEKDPEAGPAETEGQKPAAKTTAKQK